MLSKCHQTLRLITVVCSSNKWSNKF